MTHVSHILYWQIKQRRHLSENWKFVCLVDVTLQCYVVSWRLKSPTNWMFGQPLGQVNSKSKKYIKAPDLLTCATGTHQRWVVYFHKVLTMWKAFPYHALFLYFVFFAGQYTMLYVNFLLKRHTGYFLINVYVPCSLLVVLSWVSFWINREATADRIALGTFYFANIRNAVWYSRVPL